MRYLLDTGILLRMAAPRDPMFATIDAALTILRERDVTTSCTLQNLTEFWNVSTRPREARGGLGQPLAEARKRLAKIERIVEVLLEPDGIYAEWKRLVYDHDVAGVKVHDARLVATMNLCDIRDILTLNPTDFHRYGWLRVHTPATVLAVT